MLQILCVAAMVSLFLGIYQEGWSHGWKDGCSIMIAIVIIIVVTTGNNYIKQKQFQALQAKQDQITCRVIRNGVTKTIDATDIVVGDVLSLKAFEPVPADAILITAKDCVVNECSLTGESVPIDKYVCTEENYTSKPIPFLMQSGVIENGTEMTALVVAVGDKTFASK